MCFIVASIAPSDAQHGIRAVIGSGDALASLSRRNCFAAFDEIAEELLSGQLSGRKSITEEKGSQEQTMMLGHLNNQLASLSQMGDSKRPCAEHGPCGFTFSSPVHAGAA
jgi:hypothetical protein